MSATDVRRSISITETTWDVLCSALGEDLYELLIDLDRYLGEIGEPASTLGAFAEVVLAVGADRGGENEDVLTAPVASQGVRAELTALSGRLADRPGIDADDLRNLVKFVVDGLDAFDAIGWFSPSSTSTPGAEVSHV